MRVRTLGVLIAAAAIAGCSHLGEVSGPDLALLHVGMTKGEVIALLGAPLESSANPAYESLSYFVDHGHFHLVRHELAFVDGRLRMFGRAADPDFRERLRALQQSR